MSAIPRTQRLTASKWRSAAIPIQIANKPQANVRGPDASEHPHGTGTGPVRRAPRYVLCLGSGTELDAASMFRASHALEHHS